MDPNENRRSIDPAPQQMRQLGYELIDRIVDHIENLSSMPVAGRHKGSELASLVDESLPVQGSDIADCLEFFFSNVTPKMTKVSHPRFHGYIPCPSSYSGAVGMMLAAGTNPFVGSWLGGATLASLELTVLRWIKELLQLDSSFAGIFTSGGSIANLTGLASARAKFGEAVNSRGRIYVSLEGHASMQKAASILGFGPQQIETLAVDNDCRIDIDKLNDQCRRDRDAGLLPFFVSGNAGTTNTGAIDDLAAMADFCRENEIWFHVDAAYGGFAGIVPEIREQMGGLEQADSITLDPHKWLYCPMGVGCAFVRDGQYLESAFSTDGSYLKDLIDREVNFMERGPELSRPARVLPVWMVIRSTGTQELQHQIREDIRLAKRAGQLLADDGRFDVDPVRMSIVIFRNKLLTGELEGARIARDDALIEAALADGGLMLSSTTANGINCLRMVVMNHRTTEADIEFSVRRIGELTDQLQRSN